MSGFIRLNALILFSVFCSSCSTHPPLPSPDVLAAGFTATSPPILSVPPRDGRILFIRSDGGITVAEKWSDDVLLEEYGLFKTDFSTLKESSESIWEPVVTGALKVPTGRIVSNLGHEGAGGVWHIRYTDKGSILEEVCDRGSDGVGHTDFGIVSVHSICHGPKRMIERSRYLAQIFFENGRYRCDRILVLPFCVRVATFSQGTVFLLNERGTIYSLAPGMKLVRHFDLPAAFQQIGSMSSKDSRLLFFRDPLLLEVRNPRDSSRREMLYYSLSSNSAP